MRPGKYSVTLSKGRHTVTRSFEFEPREDPLSFVGKLGAAISAVVGALSDITTIKKATLSIAREDDDGRDNG